MTGIDRRWHTNKFARIRLQVYCILIYSLCKLRVCTFSAKWLQAVCVDKLRKPSKTFSSLQGFLDPLVAYDSVAGTASALVPGYTLLGPGQCQDFYETTKASWRSIHIATVILFKGLRLTAGRRPKGDYVGPTFAALGQVGPMFAYVSRMLPQVGPVLALCSPILAVCCPMLAHVGPMLALCWPKLALSCPYVGPILALCGPMMPTNYAKLCWNTFNLAFFSSRGLPWTRKPRKTRGFLIAPRWNSGTPKATKHRKTRCFWTAEAQDTVNYEGSGGGRGAEDQVGGWGGLPL